MKRILIVLISFAVLTQTALTQPARTTVTISIVGTNDLHGGILPQNGRGGLALLSSYVKNLRAARAKDDGAVLLIDAGDMFQGTLESNLEEGAPVVAAYNALGYVASTIGNHEFDYGPVGPAATVQKPGDDPRGALKARAAEAHFPFLSANIIESSTGLPVSWPNVKPSMTVDAAGMKVGIIGIATAETLSVTMRANTIGLSISPLSTTIAREATRLRSAGARVIIVTAHAGGSCTKFDRPTDLSSCGADDEIVKVARELPAGLVDVIVAGHVHQAMAHEVAGVDIVESYSGGRAFGRVDLTVDKGSGNVIGRHVFPPHDLVPNENYEGAAVLPDTAIESLLAPAVAEAATLKAMPLGVVLDTAITRRPPLESALGNLFADLMHAAVPSSDGALSNSGGVRADLPAGPLTYGRFYEALPFDNRLNTVVLTGAQLKQVFAKNFGQSFGGILVSGFRVRGQCDAGQLHVTIARDSGMPIRDDERLTIAVQDFVATGGGDILPGNLAPTDLGVLAREAMVEQLKKRGGRLSASQLFDPKRPRIVYPGPRPVHCAQ